MYKIGILQLTQFLDDAVHGFKEGMHAMDITAEFSYVNADGHTGRLQQLAQSLAQLHVDLIFACSTPAAIAAVNLPGDIPVVFTPVFDPVQAKIVQTLEKPGGKATGVAGMVPAAKKIDFIQRLLPNANQVGVLFHAADGNALLETNAFKAAADNRFMITEIPVQTPEELSLLYNRLSAKWDALFLPIGRIIEENFATIAYYTHAAKLPIIASHAPNVPAGALGALAANHRLLGCQCAEQAVQILSGRPAGNIPVRLVQKPEILLNSFVAQNLGITLPPDLAAEATEIYHC